MEAVGPRPGSEYRLQTGMEGAGGQECGLMAAGKSAGA